MLVSSSRSICSDNLSTLKLNCLLTVELQGFFFNTVRQKPCFQHLLYKTCLFALTMSFEEPKLKKKLNLDEGHFYQNTFLQCALVSCLRNLCLAICHKIFFPTLNSFEALLKF